MNIKHISARTGFDYFVNSSATMSRGDINNRLAAQGLPDVSDRTFVHYQRLVARGQLTYMPINEFDMAVKNHRL